jgi:hypothetical protein
MLQLIQLHTTYQILVRTCHDLRINPFTSKPSNTDNAKFARIFHKIKYIIHKTSVSKWEFTIKYFALHCPWIYIWFTYNAKPCPALFPYQILAKSVTSTKYIYSQEKKSYCTRILNSTVRQRKKTEVEAIFLHFVSSIYSNSSFLNNLRLS